MNPLGMVIPVLQVGSWVEELKWLLLGLYRRSASGVGKGRKSALQSLLPCLTALKCLHVKRQEEKDNTNAVSNLLGWLPHVGIQSDLTELWCKKAGDNVVNDWVPRREERPSIRGRRMSPAITILQFFIPGLSGKGKRWSSTYVWNTTSWGREKETKTRNELPRTWGLARSLLQGGLWR